MSASKGTFKAIIGFAMLALLHISLAVQATSKPYVGELRFFPLNPPSGWLPCDGQIYSSVAYSALFGKIGSTFGGNGISTFAVPDLRGRTIVGQGSGPGLSSYTLGQVGGVESVTLTTLTMPAHIHTVQATILEADSLTPASSVPGQNGYFELYTEATPNTPLAGASISLTGSGQSHPNMQPFLAGVWAISVNGV